MVRVPIDDGKDYRVMPLKGFIEYCGEHKNIKASKEIQARNEKTIKEWLKEEKATLIRCGHCPACKMESASSWANRMEMELPYHENAWFLTITYDNENVPYRYTWDTGTGEVLIENLSLCYDDIQKFWKNLRRNIDYHKRGDSTKLKYYAAGEYGGTTHRPHYHAIVYDLPILKEELKYYKKKNGIVYYNVDWLNKVWGKGYIVIAPAEWHGMAYTARYTTKKIYGKEGKEFYESLGIEKENCWMSKKPAIGELYYYDHAEEIYKNDKIQLKNGRVCKPPRYFDKLFDLEHSNAKPLTDEEVERIEDVTEKAESEELQAIKRKRRKLANDALFAKLKQNNGLTLLEYYNKEDQIVQERFKKLIRNEI